MLCEAGQTREMNINGPTFVPENNWPFFDHLASMSVTNR